jgi:hypothetical protein
VSFDQTSVATADLEIMPKSYELTLIFISNINKAVQEVIV